MHGSCGRSFQVHSHVPGYYLLCPEFLFFPAITGRYEQRSLLTLSQPLGVPFVHPVRCLESEDLVLELAHGPGLLVTDGLGSLLQAADHGWRPAEQNLDVVGGLGEPFLQSKG
jgi:hypothetical protein